MAQRRPLRFVRSYQATAAVAAYGAAMTEMSYVIPIVNEIVDPRSGRPISAIGDESQSQRALVAASLLRLPDR